MRRPVASAPSSLGSPAPAWPRSHGAGGEHSRDATDQCRGALAAFRTSLKLDRHRYELDNACVLRVVHALRPNRISLRVRGATSVPELPAGTLTRVRLIEGAESSSSALPSRHGPVAH